MTKCYTPIQRLMEVLACWSILAGIALAQQNGAPPGPDQHTNPACWPLPCGRSTEDPDSKHDFNYFFVPPLQNTYAEFDALALQCKPQNWVDLASQGPSGNSVLSTGNFAYDLQAGGRVLVGYAISDCLAVEAQYTAIATSDNNASIRDNSPNAVGGTGNLFSPFGGFGTTPVTGVDYMNYASIHYTTSLQGVELNIRRQVPMPPGRATVSILGGIRYNDIAEEFEYDTLTSSPAPLGGANNFHVHTDNQMVGAQIGGLFELYIENRWWLDCEVKGVIFSDRALVNVSYQNINNTGAISNFSNTDQETHTAFAEELALTLVYRWSPHVTTRLGYQIAFVQDVALAPQNLPTDLNVIRQGPVQVSHDQNLFFQGPVAGIAVAW